VSHLGSGVADVLEVDGDALVDPTLSLHRASCAARVTTATSVTTHGRMPFFSRRALARARVSTSVALLVEG
jgi:hypothetical protein